LHSGVKTGETTTEILQGGVMTPQNPDIDNDHIIVRLRSLLTAEMPGETLGLSIEEGTCFSMNPVAAEVWNLTLEPRSFGSLIETLLNRYEVEEAVCRKQVSALLRQFQSSRLIEISKSAIP
jgi:hypothetical protein